MGTVICRTTSPPSLLKIRRRRCSALCLDSLIGVGEDDCAKAAGHARQVNEHVRSTQTASWRPKSNAATISDGISCNSTPQQTMSFDKMFVATSTDYVSETIPIN